MFNEVMAMLASVKARLMKHAQITCSASDQVGGRVVDKLEFPTEEPVEENNMNLALKPTNNNNMEITKK